MVCQNCSVCGKDVYEDYLCLYVDRDCHDGCDYCVDNHGNIINDCKYEGGSYDE